MNVFSLKNAYYVVFSDQCANFTLFITVRMEIFVSLYIFALNLLISAVNDNGGGGGVG